MNGVKFHFYHSYDFFDLILNSKEIGGAEIKKNYIEVPGADGVIDLTHFFGSAKYHNRILIFNFTINPAVGADAYLSRYSNIQTILHGTKRKIYLDEEPEYYYYGLISVGEYICKNGQATFTITCDCEPYKMEDGETVVSQKVSSNANIALSNTKMPTVPTITTNAEFLISYGGYNDIYPAGTFTIPELELTEGNNQVYVEGTGTITFSYRKGRL